MSERSRQKKMMKRPLTVRGPSKEDDPLEREFDELIQSTIQKHNLDWPSDEGGTETDWTLPTTEEDAYIGVIVMNQKEYALV